MSNKAHQYSTFESLLKSETEAPSVSGLLKIAKHLFDSFTELKLETEDLNCKLAELKLENEDLNRKLAELKLENENLKLENAALKKQLAQNSTNSSKPPSSDGLRKKNTANKNTSLRGKSGKKNGGQKGHKGNTLKQVENPDHIVIHEVKQCCGCSADLSSLKPKKVLCRQVFDIPAPKIEVTEHQVEIKKCPDCKLNNSIDFPEQIRAPVQYGQNVQSFALYLQNLQLIPEQRLTVLLKDLFNVDISASTISSYGARLHENLEKFEDNLIKNLSSAPIKHLGETGFRISGQTSWLHVMSDQNSTYYHISKKRKVTLKELEGIVVHDHWKPYFKLENVKHSLCNAHHLRELNAVIEDGESWAKYMKELLLVMSRLKNSYGGDTMPKKLQLCLCKMYDDVVHQGLKYHESLKPLIGKRGRIKRRTGHNLLMRLQNYSEDTLRFIKEPMVPFTNNQAENDLRMMKCKQKISGGFRTFEGGVRFARIRSFISTVRKQGFEVLDLLSQALSGKAVDLF